MILASPTSFFFASSGEQPTTLDITLVAQLLVLAHAPLPSNPIHDLLKASYPALLEHAQAVMKVAFPRDGTAPMVGVMRSTGVAQALGRTVKKIVGLYTDEDARVTNASTLRERIAYTWVGLAGLGTVAYLLGTILVHGITIEETRQEERSGLRDLDAIAEAEVLDKDGATQIAVTEAIISA